MCIENLGKERQSITSGFLKTRAVCLARASLLFIYSISVSVSIFYFYNKILTKTVLETRVKDHNSLEIDRIFHNWIEAFAKNLQQVSVALKD